VIRGGESCRVAGVADQERSNDRSDSVDIGHGGVGDCDCSFDQGLVGFDVPVESADVGEVGSGIGTALFSHVVQGAHVAQQLTGPVSREGVVSRLGRAGPAPSGVDIPPGPVTQ
jgi:hypothetical protein